MKVTELEPKKVFEFFSEISSIPHGSGNTAGIAEYCIRFAAERGLKSYKDSGGNVMIFKDGTEGYENSEPVILQGHLDMVCEKSADSQIDMEKESIVIYTDGEYVRAKDTTLGGDDGIAVAYILALLDSDDILHPPIEALLTCDEEIGMLGAESLDASKLFGKRLINIDSEEEGVLTVSCAGGVRTFCKTDINFIENEHDVLCAFEIVIDGLLGGHSGIDINKHRTNAAKLMGQLLYRINCICNIGISQIQSGGKVNVIPSNAKAVVCAESKFETEILNTVKDFKTAVKAECLYTEPNITITINKIEIPKKYTDSKSAAKIIFMIMQVPDGVQSMNYAIPDMVQTSINLGSAYFKDNNFNMEFLIRSNDSFGKRIITEKLESLVNYTGGIIGYEADYPAWEYTNQSPLRDAMVSVYKEMYGKEPCVTGIHAGLECGILAGKINGVDMVSFGPDLENVHTPNERMNVKSVERCWNYLVNVLRKLK